MPQQHSARPRHRLIAIDPKRRIARCSVCGVVDVTPVSKSVPVRGWRCGPYARANPRVYRPKTEAELIKGRIRAKEQRQAGKTSYRRTKTTVCSRCGFVAEHPVQMDVHHLDGNHRNDARENLTTLCANCHRLFHIPPTQLTPIAPTLRLTITTLQIG